MNNGKVTNKTEKTKSGNPRDYVRITKIIQSVLVSLAVIVGGGWTAYTFLAEETVQQAKLKLVPSLSINLLPVQTEPMETGKKGLIIDVSVTNTGGRAIQLDLRNKPLRIYRVAGFQDGKEIGSGESYLINEYQKFDPVPGHEGLQLSNQIVQIGSTKIVHFYAEVKNTGLYLITFIVPMDKTTLKEMDKEVDNEQSLAISCYDSLHNLDADGPEWIALKYFVVKDKPDDGEKTVTH